VTMRATKLTVIGRRRLVPAADWTLACRGLASVSTTGGQKVVDALISLGVEHVFGIPGNHNLPVYHALRDRTDAICHVTARHEQGAGFMAEGFARATGQVGVALAITGPGLTNMLTPMGNALHDSVPMLVISSQVPTHWQKMASRGYLHHLQHSSKAAACAAKASFVVEKPSDIAEVLRRAHELASAGRRGPVHVEIALDLLQSSCPSTPTVEQAGAVSAHDKIPANSLQQSLRAAATRLAQCQKPLILVGGGAVEASKMVASLAESLDAPVISTCAGKGILDDRHPLSLGCRLHCPAVQELVQQSDCLLLLGTQLSPTDWWSDPMAPEVALPNGPDNFVVHVDIDPGSLQGSQRSTGICIEMDCSVACQHLLDGLDELRPKSPLHSWSGAKAVVAKARSAADDAGALASMLGWQGLEDQGELMQSALLKLRAALPEESVATFDMCRFGYAGLSLFPSYSPRKFLHPVGFGTLGFALPAAIGAAQASPGIPVLAVQGDGGLQFTLPELAVACERKLPILVVVWNDKAYGEIQRQMPDDFATSLPLPDFGKLSDAYGVPHLKCSNDAELDAALASGVLQNLLRGKSGPVMLEVDVFSGVSAAVDINGTVVSKLPGIQPGLSKIAPYAYSATVQDVCKNLNVESILKLSSNENSYGPFPVAVAAIKEELENCNRYPDHQLVELKAGLARHLQETTKSLQRLDPSNICIMQGAEVGAMLIASSFLEAGDECIVTTGYYVHQQASLLHGGRITSVALKDNRVDLEAIAAAVGPTTKLVWLTNPHSPLGTLFDHKQLHKVLEAIKVRTLGRGRLILDEVYADFCDVPGALPDSLRLILDEEPVISLRSFSKSAGLAGLRIGFAIASKDVICALDTGSNPFTMSRPALAAAGTLFKPSGNAAWRECTAKIIEDRKKLEDDLSKLPGVVLDLGPSNCNFVTFKTPAVLSQDLAQDLLLECGILVRPGGSWGLPNHTRVSIGTTAEMARFTAALPQALERCQRKSEGHKEPKEGVHAQIASGEFFASV